MQFLDVRHHAETALSVGMVERTRSRRRQWRHTRFASRGEFQKGLGCFCRQAVDQRQQTFLRRLTRVVQPLDRHTVSQEFVIRPFGEQGWLGCLLRFGQRRLHIDRYNDLFHRLADLNQLCGTCFRMRLQSAPLSPIVGFVVVIHVAEQQAALRPVDDEPDVAAHPHRPKVLIPRLVELVEAEA
ncbi:MAG: hypothetical protein AB7J34_23295 [Limisphaerales bacterium]